MKSTDMSLIPKWGTGQRQTDTSFENHCFGDEKTRGLCKIEINRNQNHKTYFKVIIAEL